MNLGHVMIGQWIASFIVYFETGIEFEHLQELDEK
jgi:hypothetical protein